MYTMLLCVLPLAGGAEPPKEGVAKKELEKFQGTWRFVSVELNGEVIELKDAPAAFDLVVTGNKFAYAGQEGELGLHATTPPGIDLRPTKPGEWTHIGIYRIEGDTLTWCLHRGKTELTNRPTQFVTKGNKDVEVRVFKLQKPKK